MRKIITLIIGNNITSIPNRAFENSYSLKLVIIGENVTSIGDYAFYNCDGIKEINSGKTGTAPYILGGSTFAGVNKTIAITNTAIGNIVTQALLKFLLNSFNIQHPPFY